jgi:phosphoenolpyruvate carboxykinase (ATP)
VKPLPSFYQELGLKAQRTPHNVFYNVAPSLLISQSIKTGFGKLSKDGSLVVLTGKHTGRSAKDKYVVKSPSTEKTIWWENSLNAMTADNFNKLKNKIISYLNEDKDIYVSERSVGADINENIGVRFVSSHPSHTLFTLHMFRETMRDFNNKDFTILHAPDMELNPSEFGLKNTTVIATCFDTKVTLIVGSLYAGEIKKSMFCVMNYELPPKKILPMHAGASQNMQTKESSVFFGLSGTGKTTLSTDEGTELIGDDEHGLNDNGVFNFEGGCYAKTYKLSAETEPGIYSASNRFGALLENVVMNEITGEVDFNDKSIAENGRSSYPLSFIEDLEKSSKGAIPKNMFFLSADAFGVLPPVAKLTKEQAMFYFVLGYTAKLAGTEIGVVEPTAAFSPCFGAPFMLRHPKEYAELLGHYLDKYKIQVWLINTGWTGGAYGIGERFPLKTTRKIIRAIQANKLNNIPCEVEPIFGLNIPCEVEDIPHNVLNPQRSWLDQNEYVNQAKHLATRFHKQMESFGDFYQQNIKGAPLHK